MTIVACGPCSGGSCSLKFDDFNRADNTNLGADWIESGAWSIISNKLDPPSIGELRLTTAQPASAVWQAAMTFGGATGRNRWKVDRVDANNFSWAEVECTGSTAATLQLWQKVAGVDTALTTAQAITGFSWTDEFNVKVCITPGSISGQYNNGLKLVAGMTALGGTVVALEPLFVGTSARFDNAELSKIDDICPGCQEEETCLGDLCVEDKAPKYLKLKFAGIAHYVGPVTCVNCPGLNVTQIVKFIDCANGNAYSFGCAAPGVGSAADPQLDAAEQARYATESASPLGFAGCPGDVTGAFQTANASLTLDAGDYRISASNSWYVTTTSPPGCGTGTQQSGLFADIWDPGGDCLNINDVVLPLHADCFRHTCYLGNGPCDYSAATCTVSSVV